MPSQRTLEVDLIDRLIIAGWTGRNAAALEAHIKELEALGVKRPKRVPIFYRNAASLLTTAPEIECVGGQSSGEVEFVLYSLDDGLWLGVGSDHTDRKAETIAVTLSKQMCAKPVGPQLWRYDEVKPHWDKLSFARSCRTAAARRLYQEGPVTNMRVAGGADPALHRRRYACTGHRHVLRHVRGARRGHVRPQRWKSFEIGTGGPRVQEARSQLPRVAR